MNYSKTKNLSIKTVLATLVGMIVTILLHELWEDPFQDTSIFPPSRIRIAIGTMKPLLGTSLCLLFLLIAFTYNYVYGLIPASDNIKPLSYAIPAGGLWVVGMVEGTPWFNLPFLDLFLSGMADLIPIVIICVLLSVLVSKKKEINFKRSGVFPSVIVIPVLFILIRYFSYYVIGISSGVSLNPMGTFLWTIIMGFWIWVMYYYMGVESWDKPTGYKILIFGILIYGIIWISFNGIGSLISSQFSIKAILMRTLPDTFSVIISIYILSKLKSNS